MVDQGDYVLVLLSFAGETHRSDVKVTSLLVNRYPEARLMSRDQFILREQAFISELFQLAQRKKGFFDVAHREGHR